MTPTPEFLNDIANARKIVAPINLEALEFTPDKVYVQLGDGYNHTRIHAPLVNFVSGSRSFEQFLVEVRREFIDYLESLK